MFYEKKLASFNAFVKEAQIMDMDSGIRVHARYKGKKVFVFVSKSTDHYAIVVYSLKRHGKSDFPGKQIMIREVNFEDLKTMIADMATKPISAFSY